MWWLRGCSGGQRVRQQAYRSARMPQGLWRILSNRHRQLNVLGSAPPRGDAHSLVLVRRSLLNPALIRLTLVLLADLCSCALRRGCSEGCGGRSNGCGALCMVWSSCCFVVLLYGSTALALDWATVSPSMMLWLFASVPARCTSSGCCGSCCICVALGQLAL